MGIDRSLSEQSQSLLRRIYELAARWTAAFKRREIVSLIERLAETREYVVAPHLLQFCYRSDRPVALAASRAVSRLLEAVPPLEFGYLDQVMREMSPYSGCALGVPSLKRGELSGLGADDPDLTFVLGLTSFHPDGYLREEALHALAARRDGNELPFILLRLNDWVREVRAVAREVFDERLVSEYAVHFVMNLPLVLRLKDCGRDRHEDAVRQVEELLSLPEARGALEAGCEAEDRSILRACFRLAAEHGCLELCERGLVNVDPLIRLRCARALLTEGAAAELMSLLEQLRADPFMPIRREALRTYGERLPELAEEQLRAALAEDNIAMREFAAYYLKKRADIDIAVFYRQQLEVAEGRRLAVTILGIGEHGEKEDSSRVVGFFDGGSPKVKRAVLRAVARLDRERYTGFIGEALLSALPGVSREARDIVRRRALHVDTEPLAVALTTSPLPHVRRNVFLVLAERGKYDGLYHALVALRDQDELLRRSALQFISRWIWNYNRSYARPTADQLARVKRALREVQGELPETLFSQLEFYTRPA